VSIFFRPMEDSDSPRLSGAALAALADLYATQQATAAAPESVPFFEPNWGLAQFWYDKSTADLLANEAIEKSSHGRIACLSTPSVFRALVAMGYREAFLFDYDERFRVFGDQHVQYNLYEPSTQFAASLGNTFDIFILDPPRINRDVLVHVSAHVQWLARGPSPLVIAVTGAVMEDAVKELY